jgi:hypothetical protein
METKEHLLQTLEHFKQQRTVKLQEVRSLDVLIRGLEQELGDAAPASEAADSFSTPEGLPSPNVNGGSASVRPDEFFSMTQTDAAKAYLRKLGRAISMDQLLDGMKRGGAHVGGADPKATLYVSLMRNPKREFVRVSEGFVGLREFYPGLPKSARNGVNKASGARTRKRKRRQVNHGGRREKPDATEPDRSKAPTDRTSQQDIGQVNKEEITVAVRKILADGQPHTGQAVVKGVEQALGRKSKAIAVYGCLRSKEFEQTDGQYRLKK